MKEKLTKLLHLGFEGDIFSEFRTEVDAANLISLQNLSLVGTAIALIMFICSLPKRSAITDMQFGYAAVTVAMGVAFLLSRTVLKRHMHAVRHVWRVLLICVYMGGILISTVLQPTTSAVTMIVFVVAVPLFYIDRPAVIYAITCVMSVAFLVITNLVKPPELARVDTINICVFYVCGIVTYYQTVQAKMRDVSSRMQLCRQRDTDGLTGLWNRLFCETEINRGLSYGMEHALCIMMDIDNFKTINDRFGHDVGDAALKCVGDTLKRCFRAGDIIGRIGGDEFIVFLPSCDDSALIRKKISSLMLDISRIEIGGPVPIRMGASAGVSCFPKDGDDFQSLYKCADVALYVAKHSGKNRYVVYGESDKA